MSGFIDIHQHVLPGLDDGAQNYNEMAALLSADCENGITNIVATPHMTPGVEPISAKEFLEALNTARGYCSDNNLRLRIFPGSEVLYTPGLRNAVQTGRIVTLNKTHYVLIEFLPTSELHDIIDGIEALLSGGYQPIIAHVERYENLFKSYSKMEQLREKYGILYQVNCSTIINPHSFRIRHTLGKCLGNRMLDFVSTDAHNVSSRRPMMKQAYEVLKKQVDQDYADFLCSNNARRLLFEK